VVLVPPEAETHELDDASVDSDSSEAGDVNAESAPADS